MQRAILILIACGLTAILCGCWPDHTKPIYPGPETAAERNFEAVWLSSRNVLKHSGFPLDRQDPRDGIISTRAIPSSQIFEFWQNDAATVFHHEENIVQTIYRAVKVTIRRVKDSDKFEFSVEVLMARSDRAPAMLTSSSQYKNLTGTQFPQTINFADLQYDDASPTDDKPINRRDPWSGVSMRAQLVPLGQDTDLEHRLAQEIQKRVDTYDPDHKNKWVTWEW
ncbi:MAG: hypothetical protein KAR11_02890 [Phycisphaerae bacterium]|nr:hypothetical protein [Phycisphaerae bacterium]